MWACINPDGPGSAKFTIFSHMHNCMGHGEDEARWGRRRSPVEMESPRMTELDGGSGKTELDGSIGEDEARWGRWSSMAVLGKMESPGRGSQEGSRRRRRGKHRRGRRCQDWHGRRHRRPWEGTGCSAPAPVHAPGSSTPVVSCIRGPGRGWELYVRIHKRVVLEIVLRGQRIGLNSVCV
jgi:hypothetical protein